MESEVPSRNAAFTIPNVITVVRILATPVIIIFFLQQDYRRAMVIFLIAGLSDLVDGYIARNFRQKSPLGAVLDPLADKLLVSASFLTLGYFQHLPAWLVVTVISRDIMILGGVIILKLFNVQFRIQPARVSKWATAAQISTIFLAILREIQSYPFWLLGFFCWLTAGLTIISGLYYLWQGLRLLNQPAAASD